MTQPTFEMLPRYAKLAGATMAEVPWWSGAFPRAEFIAAIRPETRLVAVVTPNNPTGTVATKEDLAAVAASAPHAVILLDHAYVEFADEDLTAFALTLPNAVVVRTLSKAWSLAGLRVGYAIGPEEIIGWMRAAGGPYAVSRPSLALAAARLEADRGETASFVAQARADRARLEIVADELGLESTRSQANYLFARTEKPLWVRDAFAGLGIAIRCYPGNPQLQNWLRISLPGDVAATDRVEHALRTALAPEALIFDMDGVLADVSQSQTTAILEAVAAFGGNATRADIMRLKAAGNANNDWVLVQRLVAEAGREISLAEATAKFEELYQGTAETPGLKLQERLLCDVGWLENLAATMPLGIVTGRPRQDAEFFLTEKGIAHCFNAVVVAEDAPLKPSPEPVRLCLKKLGVTRAWMLGDTPDDMRAARAAGVVPLGVVAPGDELSRVSPSLTGAGAARVVVSLSEIEALLP